MAKYKKDKQGRYYLDKIIGGERCMLRGKTEKEVNEKLKAWLDKKASDQKTLSAGPLFQEVADCWWMQKQPKLKYSTTVCYKPALNRAKVHFFDYRISEIVPSDIDQFIGELTAQGFAANTIANQKSVLNMIFNYWRYSSEWTGTKLNPVTGFKLPANLPRSERLPPTEKQVAIIKANPEGFGIVPNIFCYTGMRLGELNALQWKDIDFEENLIYIFKSASWHGNSPFVDTPKTKNSVRKIPLLLPLRELLLPRKQDPEIYVMSGTEAPMSQTSFKNHWATYCNSVGLATRERVTYGKTERYIFRPCVTAHQFRHEFASCLYEAGIGEMEAQVILGHADIATTRKIYTHIKKRQLESAALTLYAFFTHNQK